jgi:hypothetical protein
MSGDSPGAGKGIVKLSAAELPDLATDRTPLNELKATGIKVGLLINFGRTKVEFKRLVF